MIGMRWGYKQVIGSEKSLIDCYIVVPVGQILPK